MVGACSQELDIIQEADSQYYLEKHDAKKQTIPCSGIPRVIF
jgi:hypothetical protein